MYLNFTSEEYYKYINLCYYCPKLDNIIRIFPEYSEFFSSIIEKILKDSNIKSYLFINLFLLEKNNFIEKFYNIIINEDNIQFFTNNYDYFITVSEILYEEIYPTIKDCNEKILDNNLENKILNETYSIIKSIIKTNYQNREIK